MCEESSKIKFGKIAWDADWVGFSRKSLSLFSVASTRTAQLEIGEATFKMSHSSFFIIEFIGVTLDNKIIWVSSLPSPGCISRSGITGS